MPILGLISMAIAIIDRKTPFFVQERIGYRGRPFQLIKFRTMVENADELLERMLARDPRLREEWYRAQKLQCDPRVTAWGRVLRRWSFDELPQLLNVLSGRMSLIGPRPLPPDHYRELRETTRMLRDRVRPGMTGLWQVSGRSESGTTGMDRWDASYVRNWSIWLDIVILVRTVRAVVTGRGAY
jgi:lipopolysaccharide/colanic/teichoic acid biosynthesis glycosyltransferase